MKLQKILYIVTKSNWGGAQRYVYDLATNLPKDNFEAVVIAGQGDVLQGKLALSGIRMIQLPTLKRDFSLISAVIIGLQTIRILLKEKPDVLHLNSAKASGIGAVAGRFCGVKKIIYTVHGFAFNENRSTVNKSIIWFFSWVTILLSHTTIVISKKELSQARAMPFVRKKITLIYNGIAPMQFGTGKLIREAFPPGVTITGTIGELTANKNQEALIEQAMQAQNMHVAIVGEGELRDKLEKKIETYNLQNRVKLFGFMQAEEVLKGFDVFTLPSIKEGLPYVLLEARAAQLPIVANRVGGVGEILDAKDLSEFSLERMLEKTITLYQS